jgi:RNA polymerase sigma-70 factor (ECF subfamily)
MVKTKSMTDEQLVLAYAQGNNEAFDLLLKKYEEKVFTYILRVVKNEDIANDIFQDTFVKAIMTIKQGRYTESGKFPGMDHTHSA